MKFIDINKQYKYIKKEIDSSINSVLNSGNFVLGKEVEEVEESLADFAGARYCISNSNGTDALEIILRSLDLKKTDEVIVPSFTWVSTAEAPKYLGLKVVFCDVNPRTFNVCESSFKKLINKNTKVLIAVSLFGQCSELMKLKKICKQNNIILIEDAAQSFGAVHKSKKSCSIADYSFTSFFPSKPLGCYGDGGAIFVNQNKKFKELSLLCRHGQISRDDFRIVGKNSRLDAIQAAILKVKLKYFDEEILKRNNIYKMYSDYINPEKFKVPFIERYNTSVFAQFTLKSDERSVIEAQTNLTKNNIPSVRYYTKPIHKQKPYTSSQNADKELPITNTLSTTTISLPMHPYITKNEVIKISKILNKV